MDNVGIERTLNLLSIKMLTLKLRINQFRLSIVEFIFGNKPEMRKKQIADYKANVRKIIESIVK